MSAIEEQIRRYFAGELSEGEARALRARVREDDAARAIYDRHAATLSAVSRREASRAEGERIWQAVAGELDLGARPAPSAAAPSRSKPQIWRWLPALAGVLLMVGMVMVVVRPGPEVGIKGGGDSAPVADVDFDIFAIHKKQDGSFAQPRRVAAGDSLSMRDYIQFRTRSGDAALKRLYLGAFVAAVEGGQPSVLFYYPRAENPSPLPAVFRSKLEPVGRSIKLAARHRPGELVLFALFAERAPSIEVAKSALGRALVAGGGRLDGWPGKVALLRKSYTLEAKEASP